MAENNTQKAQLVILGASGGIGQYLVHAFRSQYQVFGTYHSQEPSERLPDVEYQKLELTDRPAVAGFCSEIAGRLQRPVVVYAAGISPNNVVHKCTDADWDLTLDVNLTGAMLIARGLLPRMREVGFGRFIFLSSVLSRTMVPGSAAYSVSKAGLGALARVIAVENAKKGITANTLALGYHEVGIISSVPQAFLEEKVLPSIPVGRLGNPANIRNAVQFLVDSDYVTGATLDINGGIIGA
ncbi:MAG: SDR family oxidoreductase [Planctomycetes bacterium]|jgi:NAD(P)-dependent dehydrogenase (short-subunit alcohol dehydrogenase family)|nr:SDR family oxidoreductase [Planctomycetota bacterium]MCC7064944.1 SDR family oxidoreductase [Planctomycetota bacterium]